MKIADHMSIEIGSSSYYNQFVALRHGLRLPEILFFLPGVRFLSFIGCRMAIQIYMFIYLFVFMFI